MAETAEAPAPVADAAPATEAAPAEATPETTQAAPVEGETAAPPAEAPPADPPRLAEAKRLAKKAEADRKAAEAKLADLEAKKAAVEQEVEQTRQLLRGVREAAELGRDLMQLRGQPVGKILARLKAAGVELDVRSLSEAILKGEDDDDDRPLTRRQLRELQEQETKRRQEEETKRRQQGETEAQQRRAAEEAQFVKMVETSAKTPSAAKLAKVFGSKVVLEDAWKAVAELKATGAGFTAEDVLERTERAAAKRLADLGMSAAPAAPAPVPQALTNKTSAAKPAASSKPKSKEERWEEALRDISTPSA